MNPDEIDNTLVDHYILSTHVERLYRANHSNFGNIASLINSKCSNYSYIDFKEYNNKDYIYLHRHWILKDNPN